MSDSCACAAPKQVLRCQQGKHNTYVFTFEGEPVKKAGGKAWRNALMLLSNDYAEAGYIEAELPAMKFLAKAVALESAIVGICERFKVDLAAIKIMAKCTAGCNDGLPKQLPNADESLVREYTDMLAGLIPS